MAYCSSCDRHFPREASLQQHYQMSRQHALCGHCSLVFNTSQAYEQHRKTSAAHNICFECDDEPDYRSRDDLGDHQEDRHCTRGICGEELDYPDQINEYKEDEHNWCHECERILASSDNLRQHRQVHQPRDKECYGCDRMFKSVSGMMIHLESGNCACECDASLVKRLALECYQHRQYTSGDDGFPFECPVCPNKFKLMSGLLQHVESNSCNATVEHPNCLWKFLHYLSWKI